MLTELLLLLFLSLASCPLAFFWGACPCCGACQCTPGTSFQVDVAGVANNGFCLLCGGFNATYYLTASATNCQGGSGLTCHWEYSNTTLSDPCGPRGCPFGTNANGVCVRLFQTGSGAPTWETTVEVQAKGSTLGCDFAAGDHPGARFRKSFGSQPDCTDFSALDVPYVSTLGSSFDCDWSAATVTVTAI